MSTYLYFSWYCGIRPDGTSKVFRFPKGEDFDQAKFDAYVQSQNFTLISHPYKTKKAAEAAQ